jgi:NAD(P)-dependent dehydrogenase (short-subunit alcohol dehydrogenase family)
MGAVRRTCTALAASDQKLDVLVLNAGVLPGSELVRTRDGVEITHAASLVGHHVLTLRLLSLDLLRPRARIIIAGSEGARGDAPGMKPTDLHGFAKDNFEGDLEKAVRCLLTMEPPARHHWSTTYCTAKALVALWAVALAPHLPEGTTVNAVSPGNAPATNAARHQPWYFRAMIAFSGVIGPAIGMAASVGVGARRYLDAADMGDEVTGGFFASPRGRLVGPLTRQEVEPLNDVASARACWSALAMLTGEKPPDGRRRAARAETTARTP